MSLWLLGPSGDWKTLMRLVKLRKTYEKNLFEDVPIYVNIHLWPLAHSHCWPLCYTPNMIHVSVRAFWTKRFFNCPFETIFLVYWPTYATNQNYLSNICRRWPKDYFSIICSKSSKQEEVKMLMHSVQWTKTSHINPPWNSVKNIGIDRQQ